MHKHLLNVISKKYPINLYTHHIFVTLCLTLTQRDSGIYLCKKIIPKSFDPFKWDLYERKINKRGTHKILYFSFMSDTWWDIYKILAKMGFCLFLAKLSNILSSLQNYIGICPCFKTRHYQNWVLRKTQWSYNRVFTRFLPCFSFFLIHT